MSSHFAKVLRDIKNGNLTPEFVTPTILWRCGYCERQIRATRKPWTDRFGTWIRCDKCGHLNGVHAALPPGVTLQTFEGGEI